MPTPRQTLTVKLAHAEIRIAQLEKELSAAMEFIEAGKSVSKGVQPATKSYWKGGKLFEKTSIGFNRFAIREVTA